MTCFRLISFATGYVENNSLGQVFFLRRGDSSEDTAEQVLSNFANDLFTKWFWDTEGLETWLIPENFEQFIEEIPFCTADRFGGSELEEWRTWVGLANILSVPLEETIEIFESGEDLILAFVDFDALGELEHKNFAPTRTRFLEYRSRRWPGEKLEKGRAEVVRRHCRVGGIPGYKIN
jgi:hypothetical protein